MSQASYHSDAVSDTSTELYGQEPYSTFSSRVLPFAHQRFWPEADISRIQVTRMSGGSFNRITGISCDDHDVTTEYILRTSRNPEEHIDGEVALLMLLRLVDKDIPVPRIISYDLRFKNDLQSTFMVQHRIPGQSLDLLFKSLNHQQKCKLARELGMIRNKLLHIRSNHMGEVTFLPGQSASADEGLGIAPFPMEYLYGTPPVNRPMMAYHPAEAVEPHAFEFFHQTFSAYLEFEENRNPPRPFRIPHLQKIIKMVSWITKKGWLKDIFCCLSHGDFEARNIMVQIAHGHEHHDILTGILDWDKASFAPCFVSCIPPVWLWAWDDINPDELMDHRVEWSSHLHPTTAEARELKRTFDEAAGEMFQKLAYEPVYKICRGLFRVAKNGIDQQYILDDVKSMLKEWSHLKHQQPGRSHQQSGQQTSEQPHRPQKE